MNSHFKSWHSYRDFEEAVKHSNRYIRSKESEEFLLTLRVTSEEFKERIEPESIFWRAQLGYKKKESVHSDGEHFLDMPCPFPPERMKPLYRESPAGRANPKGIPYLYLATDQKTAISEVRPLIGSMVSAAQFKTNRELEVINFTEAKFAPSKYENLEFISYEREPEPDVRRNIVWTEINEAFSRPITPNDRVNDYVPTQIIAELFKNAGLDGIAYASSLGDGHNLVIFDIEALQIANCFLCKVKKINVDYDETGNSYFIEVEEKKDE